MEIYNVIMLSILVMLIFGGIIWRLYSAYTTRKKLSFMYWKVQPGDVIVVELSDKYDPQIKYRREYTIIHKRNGEVQIKRWRDVTQSLSFLEHEVLDWFDFAKEVGYETLTSKYGE